MKPREKIIRLVSLLFMGVGIPVLLGPGPALADTGPWSEPVAVSDYPELPWSWFPSIAIDRQSNIHMVWSASIGTQKDGKDAIMYSRWDGKSWSKPNDLAVRNFGDIMRPSILADAYGNVHLFYLYHNILHSKASVEKAWSVAAWSNPKIISGGTGAPYLSSAVMDSTGAIHVVWVESAGVCGTCYRVFYRNSKDGGLTWSSRVTLSANLADRAQLQIRADAEDRLHVAWEEVNEQGSHLSAAYASSTDGGKNWSPPVYFVPPAGQSAEQPAIGVDGQGNILAVWRTKPGNQKYYQVSSDGGKSWTSPAQIPGSAARSAPDPPFDKYDMSTDSGGNVHLVSTADKEGGQTEAELHHSEWNGRSWGRPQVIYSGPLYPEYPTVLITEGNKLNVVWFTRRNVWEDGGMKVWYSSARSTSPKLPVPTQMPAPPTATPSPVAPKTPTPTPIPLEPSESGGDSDLLHAPSLPLAAGVAPVVVLLLTVSAVRLRRRWRR